MNPEDDRLYNFLKVIGWFVLAAAIVIVVYIVITGLLPVNGQTPPAPTNPTPPPAQLPTPVPTPTPTQPNPNLQYLPQKAYVQAFAPENGIPANSQPLQVVPQTVPAPVQQTGPSLGIPGMDIAGVLALGGVAVNYVKNHLLNKTVRTNSTHIAEGTVVDKELARLMFTKDPVWAKTIDDSPATKLETLEDNTKKATETASKA